MREVANDQRPDWCPENPYPESVFPMTTSEYLAAIPDPVLRTRISGYCGRVFWDLAERTIFDAMEESREDGNK